MPTPSTAKLPKPKSEDEFEDMVADFLRLRWKDPNAQRHGRRGQRQHGVDVVGHPPWLNGKTVGGQSKNTDDVTLATVIAEVDKATKFPGGLAEFYVVTSADRDAALQSAVRLHFKAHPAPFDVEVVFWSDVTADLAQDEVLVAKHWKGFGGGGREAVFRDQLLIIKTEALRMKEHAEHLNAGIAHGFYEQYIALKFRPALLEDSVAQVLGQLADQRVLLTSLNSLRGAASAADSEVDRLLADGGTFDRLRDLLLLLMSNATQVGSCIDQVLAKR